MSGVLSVLRDAVSVRRPGGSVSGSGAVAVDGVESVSEVLLKAVRAGRRDEVAGLLDGMTDPERRLCLPALKELRKEIGVWKAA